MSLAFDHSNGMAMLKLNLLNPFYADLPSAIVHRWNFSKRCLINFISGITAHYSVKAKNVLFFSENLFT